MVPSEKFGKLIAGFVWFQGYNDMVGNYYPNRNQEGGYDEYTKLLEQMIRDIRSELKIPNLPVVVGALGIDGPVTAESEAAKSTKSRGIMPNFRKAQAAVADVPDFKGNVSVVMTEKFWDPQLPELFDRSRKIRDKVSALAKESKLSRTAQSEMTAKLTKEEFTEEEHKILSVGIAQQSYHYIGSAKIYGQIGKAFAETLAGMMK